MTTVEETKIRSFFRSHGELEKRFPKFIPRIEQENLAVDVFHAIHNKSILIAEAGTGTGKTLSYLIPALESGKKIIISTGTKNLQDQLVHRDIPRLRKCISFPGKVALLKGRSNYICLEALENRTMDLLLFKDDLSKQIVAIQTWAHRTKHGDIAELVDIPEDSPIWTHVTSTAESCLGSECPHYDDCFLIKARRQAMDADLIIANHHLFFADLLLRREGFGELLPKVDAIILDEAHQLAEIATHWFGEHLSSYNMIRFLHELEETVKTHAPESAPSFEELHHLEKRIRELRVFLGEEGRREQWNIIHNDTALQAVIADCLSVYEEIVGMLSLISERHIELEKMVERAQTTALLFSKLTKIHSGEMIHWFETSRSGFTLHQTPISVAKPFRAAMDQLTAGWIFCSATLAIDGQFQHFASELGIEDAKSIQYDSPFNYAEQGLYYIPRGIPDPNSRLFTTQIAEEALKVIEYTKGRTLFLFTSYRAMDITASLFEGKTQCQILMQGTKPKGQLIEEFLAAESAILLATASFWEGVDIRGDDLVCVIIDKLPFATPNDPVLKERLAVMKRRGQDPFYHYQLPSAVISLRQGVGRLIRSVEDHGIVMLADPRLCAREYAYYFWNSLPPMPVTRDLNKVKAFLYEHSCD